MYNTQEIANKIKQLAKNKNVTVKQLLEKCDLSINTISDLSKGQQISYINFARIADYLGCSVDYLLGRTDNPDGTGNNISQSNIAGNKNASINNASPAPVHDSVTDEFMKIFKELSFEDKAELMHSAAQMKKKED